MLKWIVLVALLVLGGSVYFLKSSSPAESGSVVEPEGTEEMKSEEAVEEVAPTEEAAPQEVAPTEEAAPQEEAVEEVAPTEEALPEATTSNKVTLKLADLTCENCVESLTTVLENTFHAKDVVVQAETGDVTFVTDDAVEKSMMSKSLEDLGYKVESLEIEVAQ